jgi:hypothetical protein
MRKWSFIFGLILLALIVPAGQFEAAEQDTPIGDSYTTPTVLTGTFYENYRINSNTYVFDGDGGHTATSGQIPTGDNGVNILFFEKKSIFFNVVMGTCTSIDFIIQGRANNSTTWAEIYTKSFTTDTTYDFVVPVQEHVDFIRVGCKKQGSASAATSVNVTFSFRNNQ